MPILPYTSEKSSKHSPQMRLLLLVDPQPPSRGPVAEFLRSAGGMFEVIAVAHAEAFDESTAATGLIHLSVFNIGSARVGDSEIRRDIGCLRTRFPGIPLVLLANSVHISEVQIALRLGVRGYMPTYLSAPDMLAGLRVVLAGGLFVPAAPADAGPALQGLAQDHPEPPACDVESPDLHSMQPLHLTFREDEVLRFLRQGRTNREIARALNMADSTVKVHVRNIMRKLRATNRMQAVEIADRDVMHGLPVPDEHAS